MGVKKQLRPYIKRIYQGYFFKVVLISISLLLMVWILVSLLSKFVLLVDVWSYQLMTLGFVAVITILLAWLKRPKKKVIYKKIDQLGFENRLTTYLEYKDKKNPFTEYLEKDLLKSFKTEHFKKIKRCPDIYYFIVPVTLSVLLTGLNFWTTESSLKGQAIKEDIKVLENQEVALEEILKDELKDLEDLQLVEKNIKESLKEIKSNLKEENRLLAEQNLFKMQEALDQQLTGEGLPEAVEGIIEGIKEVALETDGPTLLSSLATNTTLSEGVLSEGQLSEGDLSDTPSSQTSSNSKEGNPSENGT